jgi:deoxyguanosine kinase
MYLVVEGPIGVGKTSLTRLLAERYGAALNLEVVEENPFLAQFYEQPAAYSFQVQVFFLLSRFKQLSALAQGGLFGDSEHVVSDYLFAKDFIFAAMNLRDHEFALYEDLYSHLSPRLATPNLVIYLRAEPDVLLRRIEQRARPYEAAVQAEYLAELTRRYDAHFASYQGTLLTVPAGELDFVGNLHDQAALLQQIELALGPQQAAD